MIIGATFFIGSLLRWGFQLMEKILKPEEDVELIKEVDKEVEAKERALLVWDSHMKALIDLTNIKTHPWHLQKFLAEISASNTLRTAEDAIKAFSFPQEVLIVSCSSLRLQGP